MNRTDYLQVVDKMPVPAQLEPDARRPQIYYGFGVMCALGCIAVSLSAATGQTTIIIVSAFAVIFVGFVALLWAARHPSVDSSFIILTPLVISLFQTVYLAPFARDLNSTGLQITLSINILDSFALLIAFWLSINRPDSIRTRQYVRRILYCAGILTIYGVVISFVNSVPLLPMIGSIRDLIGPFVFLAIGIKAHRHVTFENSARVVALLAALAGVYAVCEYMMGFRLWDALDIAGLWQAKGLPLSWNQLVPANFYASEQLSPGIFMRRMAGPFGDPVHYGTFLYASIVVAWYLRRNTLMFIFAGFAILTASKGVLLSGLVALIVWVACFRSRMELVIWSAVSALIAIAFYAFTIKSSTGSAEAHVDGLLTAFRLLPEAFQGRGFGSVGTLATTLGHQSELGIAESGLGVIIGQLGVAGVVSIIWLYLSIIRRLTSVSLIRRRACGYMLCLGFFANMSFNQVALSPNSAYVYFVLLGLILAEATYSQVRDIGMRPPQRYGRVNHIQGLREIRAQGGHNA